MQSFNRVLAAASMAVAMVSASAVIAAGESENQNLFVRMKADKDGMVSKSEVMKMVEKAFEKHDTKKMGKLDKKQLDAFLAELMKSGG